MKRTTVGIVGLGSAGQRHVKNALALDCDVIAYDIDPTLEIDTQLSTRTRLGNPLDADMVVIACPADAHLDWMVDAQKQDLRVLVEKPVASPDTLCDASLVRTKGVTVGYNWLWDDGIRRHMGSAMNAHEIYVSVETNVSTWPGKRYTDLLFEHSHELAVLDAWMGPLQLRSSFRDDHGGVLAGVAEHDTRRRWVLAWRVDVEPGSEGRTWYTRSSHSGRQYRMVDVSELDVSYLTMMRDFIGGYSESVCGWDRGLRVANLCAQANDWHFYRSSQASQSPCFSHRRGAPTVI